MQIQIQLNFGKNLMKYHFLTEIRVSYGISQWRISNFISGGGGGFQIFILFAKGVREACSPEKILKNGAILEDILLKFCQRLI